MPILDCSSTAVLLKQPDLCVRVARLLRARARAHGASIAQHEQEDLVQETLFRVLNDACRHPDRLWQYLDTIASHLLVDYLRLRRRQIVTADPWMLSGQSPATATLVAAPNCDLDVVVSHAETWISSQPPAVAAFFAQRVYGMKSQRSVANTLGLSRRKLRTLEARIWRDLRCHLRCVLPEYAARLKKKRPKSGRARP